MAIDSVLEFAHVLVRRATDAGDVVIDATVGNGHDTAVLASIVGPSGRVYGFDVQEEAIESTQTRLEEESSLDVVELVRVGHEEMDAHLPSEVRGAVAAVTFNLGYLPGSASSITTDPETTIPALESAIRVLRPGGVVTVVAYSGHAGGAEEAAAVDAWAADLPQDRFDALSYRFVNQRNDPPRLVAIEKTREADSSGSS